MTAADTDRLRDRLLALRAEALRQLAEALRQLADALPVVDTGMLRLVADVSTVLGVLDA